MGDARVDLADAIWLLSWLFRNGEPPAPPGPRSSPCGRPAVLGPGCESYGVCP